MSNDATFHRHIQVIVAKGRKLSGWALRVFDSREETLMKTLYQSLIRHSLEYCSPLWFPIDQENISAIEKIQRAFTKRIDRLQNLNYWQRLEKLNLYSLERHRERYVILYIWKSLHNLVPSFGLQYQSFEPENGVFLRLPTLPKAPGTNHVSNLIQRSILYQGVRLFNSLPKHLRLASKQTDDKGETTEDSPPSLLKYKDDLDKYLQRIPDQPTIPYPPRSSATNSIIDQKTYIRPVKKSSTQKTKRSACSKKRNTADVGDGPPPKKRFVSRWDKP